MKHKFFMIFTFCLAIAMTTLFSIGNAWSGTKKIPDAKTTIQKKKLPPGATERAVLVKKSNPYPDSIFAYECPCKNSVESAGGILMKGVIIKLKNIKCSGTARTSPVSGKVKLTWYDIKDRRYKSVTKPFTNLRSGLSVVMIPHSQTIIASRSTFLVAEIVEIKGVKDCMPYNKISIGICRLEPVH